MRHYRLGISILVAFSLGFATACTSDDSRTRMGQEPRASSDQLYSDFRRMAESSGIDLGKNRSYDPNYVASRATHYCQRLQSGEMMKINGDITFPPVTSFMESRKDRPRLETIILANAVKHNCPEHQQAAQQWIGTFTR